MGKIWEWAATNTFPGFGAIPPFRIPLDTEAIDISPVAGFYCMHERDIWNVHEFPNLAPPFRSYFMFAYGPARQRMGGKIVELNPEGCIGVHFQNMRQADGNFRVNALLCGGESIEYLMWQPVMWRWRVTPTGKFLAYDDEAEKRDEGVQIIYWNGSEGMSEEERAKALDSVGLLNPFFLATSILHCKNVSARRVLPSRQVRRAAERSGKPLYTYSVLDIKPMARTLREEGASESTGIKHALHVCRGHFKDYRDGRGLFGRYQGLFWWDQMLRGEGPSVHDKMYRVGGPSTISGGLTNQA